MNKTTERNDIFDINFNFDFDSYFDFEERIVPSKLKHDSRQTSDALKSKVKVFLDELITKEYQVKKKTYEIIDKALNSLRLPLPSEQLRIRTQQQINMLA